MKNKILLSTLITGVVLGLSACGGGGDGDSGTVNAGEKYAGTWKGDCEFEGTRSFKQTWVLKEDGSLTNTIPVWDTNTTCTGTPRGPAVATATLTYKNEIDVPNTCADGKAQEVDIIFTKVDVGSFGIFEGDDTIRTVLLSQGLSFPKHDIICINKDNNSDLHTGDASGENDGSTPEKRPKEVKPAKSFSK